MQALKDSGVSSSVVSANVDAHVELEKDDVKLSVKSRNGFHDVGRRQTYNEILYDARLSEMTFENLSQRLLL